MILSRYVTSYPCHELPDHVFLLAFRTGVPGDHPAG